MADSITIKTKDICNALKIGRHQLRVWTDSLPPFCNRKTKERSATRYDVGDLLFFAVVKHIHDTLGIAIPFIASFSESLHTYIREPQDLSITPSVYINVQTNECMSKTPTNANANGIIVDLQPAQSLVYESLGLSIQHQTQLQLGLMLVN